MLTRPNKVKTAVYMVAILGFQFGPYHVLVVSALHHCFPLISVAYSLWNVFPQFHVALLSYGNTFKHLRKLKTVALVLSNFHSLTVFH